jgi:hypothetical protein
MVAFPRGLRIINDLYFHENAVLLVAQPNLSPDDVTLSVFCRKTFK